MEAAEGHEATDSVGMVDRCSISDRRSPVVSDDSGAVDVEGIHDAYDIACQSLEAPILTEAVGPSETPNI